MRRSKQEICVDILKVLAIEGALRSTPLAHKVKVNYNILSECLDHLCRQQLIEKRTFRNVVVYAVTKKGWALIKGIEITGTPKHHVTLAKSCKFMDSILLEKDI